MFLGNELQNRCDLQVFHFHLKVRLDAGRHERAERRSAGNDDPAVGVSLQMLDCLIQGWAATDDECGAVAVWGGVRAEIESRGSVSQVRAGVPDHQLFVVKEAKTGQQQ